MDDSFEPRRGKKPNQKLKPFLVQQFLLRNTDEDHVVKASEIVDFLELCGVDAERRSIYRDIEDINKVMWLMEIKNIVKDEDDKLTINDAEEALAADENDNEKVIVCKRHVKGKDKGFYARHRNYDFDDIRLLAECVYSAKFLSQGQSDRLADVVCSFVSRHQAASIRHDALLTDRVKTNNKSVLNNISAINEAMSRRIDGVAHEPEKITFHYLQYSLDNMEKQVERRKGGLYTVSPYKLLINDGNYYLLSFDDKKQKMRTFRVDRMKDVKPTGEPREGKEAFAAINLKDYTKRVFSMYSGKQERVELRFINPLLDTVVDRFGTDKGSVWYERVDDKHFKVIAQVEVSDQFFGWLLGFGKRVKILEPESVVGQFKAYVDKVREMY